MGGVLIDGSPVGCRLVAQVKKNDGVETYGMDIYYNLKPNVMYKVVGIVNNPSGADLRCTLNFNSSGIYKVTVLSWYSSSGNIGYPTNIDGNAYFMVGSSHKVAGIFQFDIVKSSKGVIISGRSSSFDGTNMYERLFSGSSGMQDNVTSIGIQATTAFGDGSRLYLYEYTV